jgi:hypothetical protein
MFFLKGWRLLPELGRMEVQSEIYQKVKKSTSKFFNPGSASGFCKKPGFRPEIFN